MGTDSSFPAGSSVWCFFCRWNVKTSFYYSFFVIVWKVLWNKGWVKYRSPTAAAAVSLVLPSFTCFSWLCESSGCRLGVSFLVFPLRPTCFPPRQKLKMHLPENFRFSAVCPTFCRIIELTSSAALWKCSSHSSSSQSFRPGTDRKGTGSQKQILSTVCRSSVWSKITPQCRVILCLPTVYVCVH